MRAVVRWQPVQRAARRSVAHRHADLHKGALRDAFLAAAKASKGDAAKLVEVFRRLAEPIIAAIVSGSLQDEARALLLLKDDDPSNPFLDAAVSAILAQFSDLAETTDKGSQAVDDYIRRHGLEGRQADTLRSAAAGLNGQQVRALLAYRDGQAAASVPLGTVIQRVASRGDALLAQRAENVAEDQSVRASSSGQGALWDQAVQLGAVDATKQGKTWRTAGDGKVDDICRDLNGVTVPFESAFPGGYDQPPDPHFGCRCVMSIGNLTN